MNYVTRLSGEDGVDYVYGQDVPDYSTQNLT